MFENSVIESRRGSKGSRYLTLPVSVGLHSVVVVSLLFASLWRVTLPTEAPKQTYAVIVRPAIPLMGDSKPAGGPKPIERVRATPPLRSAQEAPRIAQPTRVTELPTERDSTETTASHDQITGDGQHSPGGQATTTGTGGGGTAIEDGPGTGTGGDGTSPGPIQVGSIGVKAPIVITRVQPEYPPLLARTRLAGSVMLESIIAEDGTITSVRVVRSTHPLFEQSAMRAVKEWRFRPGTLRGKPVATIFQFTVTFETKR